MEGAERNPQNNNEIDLIDLFEKIGRGLKNGFVGLFNFVVKYLSLVLSFAVRIILWNIRFALRKSPWIILTGLLTVGVLCFFHSRGSLQEAPKQGTFIKTRILNAQQLRPFLLSFNQLLSVGKYDYLSKATGVSVDALKHIKSIDPHYILDLNGDGTYRTVDFDDEWSELMNADKLRIQSLPKDSSKLAPKRLVSIKPDGLYLEVQFNDSTLSLDNFNPTPLLIKYLGSLDEYNSMLNLNYQFKAKYIARIDEEIAFADTLRVSELRRRERESIQNKGSNDGKASVIIDQGGSKPQDNSLLTSNASIELFKEKQELQRAIYYHDAPVIQTYSLTDKNVDSIGGFRDINDGSRIKLIKLTLLACIVCYLILLIIRFKKRIINELNKDLDQF